MLNRIGALALGIALIYAGQPASAQMSISNGTTTTTTAGTVDTSAPPAMPAGDAPITGGQMKVVTSVKSCLDKLPPEDAADIRARYGKPYQECQRRLHTQAVKRAEPVSAEDMQKAEAAEGPRNFVRVKKDTAPNPVPILGIKGSNIPQKSEKIPSHYNR